MQCCKKAKWTNKGAIRGVVGKGAMALPMFSKASDFRKFFMLRWKMFGILVVVETKVSNCIGKSLNLPPSTLQVS